MRSLMARVKTLHLKNLFLLTWNHQPGVLICIYWLDFLLFSDVTILSWCLQAISSRRVSLLSWKAKASPTELRKLKHSTMAPESTSSQSERVFHWSSSSYNNENLPRNNPNLKKSFTVHALFKKQQPVSCNLHAMEFSVQCNDFG